jgi:hypothetical protein
MVKEKSPGEPGDLLCGWVSKYREKISLHNIKNNFVYLKKFSNKFYSHFFWTLGKSQP